MVDRPIRRALEQVETRIKALTDEKARLENELCQALPAPAIAEAGRQLKAATETLESLEEEWLALSEQIELATAG
mgnify:FL=1